MATLGWHPLRDPCEELCKAIEEARDRWREDPAYNEVLFKLGQVGQELDLLNASPGRRAALRAAQPNQSGQEPTHREEAPMAVQR